MTDPNVIEAVRKLNRAVGLLSRRDPGDEGRAMRLTKEVDALLAAAEKPAEAAPVVTGGIQFDPEGHALVADGRRAHVDPDGWYGFAGTERAGVYLEARGLESSRRAVRAMRDAGIAAVRGEAAPVAPALPWVVRRRDDKTVVATFLNVVYAGDYHRVILGDSDTFEVAAAPTVAAVRFDAKGDAAGPGWEAESFALESPRRVSVTVDLRPGEDAGETTATILAACGRGP